MANNRISMTTSFSSVTLLILSVAIRDCCCGLGVPLPPKFSRAWTKQRQQLGLAPTGSSRSSLGGTPALVKSDEGSNHFRPIFQVYGDNSGEIGGSPMVVSESHRVPVPAQSTMYWNLVDSGSDRRRARDKDAFLITPGPTGEKASTGQRRRSPGRHSDEVKQGSVRREELSSATMDDDDDENGGGIRNGDVLSVTEFDNEEPSIQKDLERKEDKGYKNRIVAYHDDDSGDDSTMTDSKSRSEPPDSEEKQNADVAENGSAEVAFPNRQHRWSTDAVRVWGKKRAWEMDPMRVWGKRAWEMDPVRVWGKRAWEMDPVRVWGKRAWGSDPVRVLVKRAWDNDSVRVWGKREWETDPVRVWGK